MSRDTAVRSKPSINVTPLIDVLLVVLIIFMIAAPSKPRKFAAQLPTPPDNRILETNSNTLVVTVRSDGTLQLNGLPDDMGTVEDTSRLSGYLLELFKQRTTNHVYRADMFTRLDVPEAARIEKTVFIKAPRSIAYGQVTKVIDGLKGAGADPVGLQLDGLN